MKFSFKFSNLLGTVYHNGNLLFTPDGGTLISPVGNRITLFNLRSNKSQTLPIESSYNFTTLALSPNGMLLIAVDEVGQASICNLPHRIVIHNFYFKGPIQDIKFSPDGRHIAVTIENKIFIYQVPVCGIKQFNLFALKKVFSNSYDKTLCIDWSSDSSVIAVGGADMTTKIYAVKKCKNFSSYTLGSHKDSVVGCFFEENSLDIYTLSKNGQVCVWDCCIGLDKLEPIASKPKFDVNDCLDEDDIVAKENEVTVVEDKNDERFFYTRVGRHFLMDHVRKEGYVTVSAAAFNRKTHLLVLGLSNGSFFLYEMPNCYQVHSLSLSKQIIASVAFNCTGDWIAIGSAGIGHLVVWEWQSESFIMKQQGHFNNMQCLSYSPDGMYIATGAEDGKVKVWDTTTGFCFVTLTGHSSSITGVTFSQNGKVVLSSSLDGTVRAFDLNRYRNFRTFTTPIPTQLSCLTIDQSGEIICAGSEESFEVYVWAMPTGRLLSVLAGHEAPVSSVSFSPIDLVVATTSWDKTVKLWNVYESKCSRETINLRTEGLCVTYKPDGFEIAVSTLDGDILFFSPQTGDQMGTIEGRNDLYVGRRETDLITAKKILKSQAFTNLCYTTDGECIVAAGRSKYVCIYNIKETSLIKKFEITCNLSFDAVQDFIHRRKMTIFGNKALIEEREDEDKIIIGVPGSKKIDRSSRSFKPEVNVSCIRFSPTGRAWAVTSTEGLLVYSLDTDFLFDPFDLDIDNTPENVRKALHDEEYVKAIMMALRLNETKLSLEVLESIAADKVETLASYLPILYAEKLFIFVVDQLPNTQHLEFYLTWIQYLWISHGMSLRKSSRAVKTISCNLQKNLGGKSEPLFKICRTLKSICEFTLSQSKLKMSKKEDEILMDEDKESFSSDEELSEMDI